jgi:hypothetical protein
MEGGEEMKKTSYTACLAGFLCLVFVSAAVATQIQFLSSHEDVWLVMSDEVVAHRADVVWKPPEDKERDLRDEYVARVATHFDVQRSICWRLDRGQIDGIDWVSVKADLDAKYGRRIGEVVGCCVMGYVDAVQCYCATIDVYSVYLRERYRVTQNGRTAIVSVLVPTEGMGFVYSDMTQLGYPSCGSANPPANTAATCGSLGDPLVGNPCLPGNPKPPGFDRDPKDEPFLSRDRDVAATWGSIKALYDD